jgi:AraC-like DNA-binding protein
MKTMRLITSSDLTYRPTFTQAFAANRRFESRLALPGSNDAFGTGQVRGSAAQRCRGGLSQWQETRAKTMLFDETACGVSIARVAIECALSRSHFSRAFKHTTGLSPRSWLQQLRINRAKELLAESRLSITRLALECGFSDQSHFIRTFTTVMGISPGKWRARQLSQPLTTEHQSCVCLPLEQPSRQYLKFKLNSALRGAPM